jgi:hypothetical protein
VVGKVPVELEKYLKKKFALPEEPCIYKKYQNDCSEFGIRE